MPRTYIPASGVIIDKKRGKVHIINPGKVKNIAQGYYDATGFHPIRSSTDYDPDRLFDDSESGRSPRRKKKAKAKKKVSTKRRTTKKRVVKKKRR
jgi:hypothetical protein